MSKSVNKLLLELFNLALNVSEMTEHKIIFDYAGNVEKIEIYYYQDIRNFKGKVCLLSVYRDVEKEKEAELIAELLKAKMEMIKLLTGDDEIEEIIK